MRATLVLVALAACVEPAPPIEPMVTSHVARMTFAPTVANQVDILFVIDSSPAIAPHVAHLDMRLPKLMDTLATLPRGLPDLHIGVITANGDGQMRGRGNMTGAFLSDVPQINGTRTKNYTGTLAEAFRAYATVGADSAAPSRPLAAVDLALDSPANAGFRRPYAHLAIVVVTATDDSSAGDVVVHTAKLKARFTDPTKILVSTVSGPRSGPSPCGAAEAPRLHAVLDQFPNRSTAVSICNDDLADAILLVALSIKTTLGLPCWEQRPLDLEPGVPGEQRACAAFLTEQAYGEVTDVVIPECGVMPRSACWRIVEEPLCGDVPWTTRLEPSTAALPIGAYGVIECVVGAPSSQNP